MSQAALAHAIGVSQPTVSDWDRNGRISAKFQAKVRELALQRAPQLWNDSLFFVVPADEAADRKAA